MSKQQYNLSTKTDYLNRKMFLDPAGPVTIQRFEEVKYNKLAKFEQEARGFFWVPEEVSLTKDSQDFKDASDTVKHIFTSNLLRQTALDSLQGRGPSQIFTPVCSIPELEAVMYNWSFFETNIHSRSYSHIIRNIYNVPKDVFNTIHDTQEIVDMASSVGNYYDRLHVINCRKETGGVVTETEHIDAIWLALNASYALEAFRFMVSFATSLAMVENRIFIGNGNIISLILQDEIMHKEWTGWMINQVVKEDPRFAAAKIRCEDEVYQMYLDVIREEKDWAKYLFKHGPVIGLNANILIDFVDYTAKNALHEISIKYLESAPRSTPIPWFNKHVDTSKKQTALQENESTNYVIGVMSDALDYDELPNL
jgi:ribonucleoside-diphosphate reductase beta chain